MQCANVLNEFSSHFPASDTTVLVCHSSHHMPSTDTVPHVSWSTSDAAFTLQRLRMRHLINSSVIELD